MKQFLLLAIFFSTACTTSFSQGAHAPMVIAYFAGKPQELESVDVQKITHLIYCFGHLKEGKFHIGNASDSALIHRMVAMKEKKPSLKVLLSLGGWGGCENCSDGFFTAEKRKAFAASVKEVNDYFKTDGIDLDWEYPTIRLDNDVDKEPVHKTSPQDKANFTDLVQQLRKALGAQATISFAAGGFNTYLEKAVDWNAVMQEVNFVNLMSYDLINGYATETGHHTALYSTPQQKESTDNAVQYLLEKAGVPASKIVIGAAFYARVWENVPPEKNGLYQPGKFKAGIAFRQFEEKLSPAAGYALHWDNTAKAPYAYNATEKKFATFDDKRSIRLKTQYVLAHQLGGIMFWEISNDLPNKGLVDVIHETINGK